MAKRGDGSLVTTALAGPFLLLLGS